MKMIAALCLMLCAPSGFAARWVYIGSYTLFGTDTVKTYVDAQSIMVKGKYVELWSKTIHSQLVSVNPSSVANVRGSRAFKRFNCVERLESILYVSNYNDTGDIVSIIKNTAIDEPIEPDTINEKEYNLVCNMRQPYKHKEENSNFKHI